MLPGLLLTEHPRRLDIRRTLIVRRVEQTDGAEKDRLGSLDGRPSLGGCLVACLVLLRWVEDGNAEAAVGVDVGMEGDRRLEGERGREVGVLRREAESGAEISSCGVD
jgi:hypothetical protein